MSLAAQESPVASEIDALLQRLRPRANSLIVTVFGDAIMPRGGTIWLSDLVALMSPLGLSERLVRTGVYRLSQEGWLTSLSVGRRAQYSLTETGLSQFAAAGRRIYASNPAPASDDWTLVQGVADITQTERQTLRRRLKWHGFGQFSTILMARPGPVPGALEDELVSEGLDTRVLVFTSKLTGLSIPQTMRAAVAAAWPLDDLNAEYASFLNVFHNVDEKLLKTLSARDTFALRALLVHEYRRILLKDPHLPLGLLPEHWNGSAAMDLSARIYRQSATVTDAHVDAQMRQDTGSAPALSADYWERFGGLR